MTAIRVFLRRFYALFRTGRLEREMEEEFNFHLQNEVAENVRKGMSAEEALAAAQRRFGGVAQVKEAYRKLTRCRFCRCCGRICASVCACCGAIRVFRFSRFFV
jgi:hypothetical protein